ncbi:MAG TPA: ATP-binding protein [Dehalococcoidia bacterium]
MTTLRDDRASATPQSEGAHTERDALLRASERVTNAELLEALGVAVYMTDAHGVITDYNEAAVELWGRRPTIGVDEWCGSWRLYFPDGTPMAHAECPMGVALRENRKVRGGEAIAERPDGTRACFMAYPTPLQDDAGNLIGAVNVLVDITDRKSAEHALRENDAKLTTALAVKDEFLGLISHELKTPITTIFGNAQVLAREGVKLDNADRRAALDDIAREAERLHTIIEDLLVLARSENGQPIDFEPVLAARTIHDSIKEFQHKHPERLIEVSGEGVRSLVNADRTYLRQVMLNLLSNAVKYGGDGSTIEVEIAATDRGLQVHVCDRGGGIAEEDRERLFEPFYRGSSTAKMASGVGVGLAVCKRLVEAMGGDMWAKNRRGGGADVGFSLPNFTDDDS